MFAAGLICALFKRVGYVHLRATLFTLNAAVDLVAMIRNIHGSNVLLVFILKNITEYKNAVTSNINFSIVVQLLYK